jgi:hypothetical protein
MINLTFCVFSSNEIYTSQKDKKFCPRITQICTDYEFYLCHSERSQDRRNLKLVLHLRFLAPAKRGLEMTFKDA